MPSASVGKITKPSIVYVWFQEDVRYKGISMQWGVKEDKGVYSRKSGAGSDNQSRHKLQDTVTRRFPWQAEPFNVVGKRKGGQGRRTSIAV